MVKRKLTEIISFIKEQLIKDGVNPLKIIVFGSQVREDVTDDSDLDIVIVSEDFSGKDIFERSLLTKNAEILTIKKFQIPMDILTLSLEEYQKEEIPIVKIIKDGEVFYGK